MRACHCNNSGMSGDEVVSSVVASGANCNISLSARGFRGNWWKLSLFLLFFYLLVILVTIPSFSLVTSCIRRAVSQQLKGPTFLDLVKHVFKVPHGNNGNNENAECRMLQNAAECKKLERKKTEVKEWRKNQVVLKLLNACILSLKKPTLQSMNI